jgi:hypothetical protein
MREVHPFCLQRATEMGGVDHSAHVELAVPAGENDFLLDRRCLRSQASGLAPLYYLTN